METICLFVPLHITAIQDIYMANMQSRFFLAVKKQLPAIITIMTIDKDYTNKFKDLYVNTCTDYLIDLRKEKSTGIVKPTFSAIDKALQENCGVFIRLTQDTQILNIDDFVNLTENLSKEKQGFICGRKATCRNIKGHLARIGIKQKGRLYSFVMGNLIIASMNLWGKRYRQLPKHIHHYCDDSIFSYLVEHLDGIQPTFVGMSFWQEIRTRNIYYLEHLYKRK